MLGDVKTFLKIIITKDNQILVKICPFSNRIMFVSLANKLKIKLKLVIVKFSQKNTIQSPKKMPNSIYLQAGSRNTTPKTQF